MERIVIEMNMENGDYSIDFSNDGKGIGTDELIFGIVGLTYAACNDFKVPFPELISILCQCQSDSFDVEVAEEPIEDKQLDA